MAACHWITSSFVFSAIIYIAAVRAESPFQPFEIPPGAVLAATIVEPPRANISALQGTNTSIPCRVAGQQESYESLQFRRLGPGEAFVISANNDTLRNATKFRITEKYTLNVIDVDVADEGEYACAMTVSDHRVQLRVSVPPSEVRMFWPNMEGGVVAGRATNLTCRARGSRPEVSFRWYKGAVEITEQAVVHPPVFNQNGYADTDSTLEVTGGRHNEGTVFKCAISLPGAPSYRTLETMLTISGSAVIKFGMLTTSIALLVAFITRS